MSAALRNIKQDTRFKLYGIKAKQARGGADFKQPPWERQLPHYRSVAQPQIKTDRQMGLGLRQRKTGYVSAYLGGGDLGLAKLCPGFLPGGLSRAFATCKGALLSAEPKRKTLPQNTIYF